MNTAQGQVRVCVIGAGGIAVGIHLPALAEIGQARVVAVCDHAGDKAAEAARLFHVPKSYRNYLEMLDTEKPDAAFVLVQPDQSFRIALDCLTRGVHAFVEKPAGVTAYQARTLERAANARGVICQVGFNRRYIPLVRVVVDRMRAITPIEHVEGYFLKHSDAAFYEGCASALMCDTIHVVDCVRWIAGGAAQKAATLIGRYGDTPVDNAWNSVIGFDNGVSAVIHANYNAGGRIHGFALHGPNASATINLGFGDTACEAKILHCSGAKTYSVASQPPGDARHAIETFDGMRIANHTEYHGYFGYLDEDRAFLTGILTGRTPMNGIAESAESMALCELIEQGRM